METIRVFVIEDHELVREALEHFIGREGGLELAGSAATARDGLAGVGPARPDVALIDVFLPDGNGIEICRDVKSSYPDVKCVILTGAGDEAFVEAMMAGADGYIGKEAGFIELAQVIYKVASGEKVMEPIGERSIVDLLKERQPPAEVPPLKPQDVRLLELIGAGMTNRGIADELNLAEQTVKNYVSSLLAKLGLERRTQAAAYAVEFGFTRKRLNGKAPGVDV